jgi:hypothetical protein
MACGACKALWSLQLDDTQQVPLLVCRCTTSERVALYPLC